MFHAEQSARKGGCAAMKKWIHPSCAPNSTCVFEHAVAEGALAAPVQPDFLNDWERTSAIIGQMNVDPTSLHVSLPKKAEIARLAKSTGLLPHHICDLAVCAPDKFEYLVSGMRAKERRRFWLATCALKAVSVSAALATWWEIGTSDVNSQFSWWALPWAIVWLVCWRVVEVREAKSGRSLPTPASFLSTPSRSGKGRI